MKKTAAVFSGITLLTLAGCSSQLDRQTASGDYGYVEADEQQYIKIPSNVDTPEFNDDFKLPPLGDGADRELVGKKLLISSPALVLPVVTGSHVEEGSRTATVWFDQVDDSQPLNRAVWNTLLSFLDQQGIGVDSFDPEAGTLITDWMVVTSELDSPWYEWTSTERQVGRRFEFALTVQPHGRTAALKVELKDYLETVGEDVVAEINELQERREEVDILNQVIGHYEYQIRLDESRRLAKIREGIPMEMGFDRDGQPAFVIDAKYDVAWPRILLVLRKLGFDVKDLDKSTGLMFVQYNGPDSGWWEKLMSNDEALLDKDEYRLKVMRKGDEHTSITFMNSESEPFEANMIADLYDPFSRVMSQDNLDI